MNPSNPSSSENAQQGTSGGLSGATQSIKEAARDAVNQVKTTASETAGRVKEQASEMANQQKSSVADRIGGYSSAMHQSAQAFEEKDPNIAWLTHQVADRLSSAADYVRGRDLSELKSDVERIARNHPAAFFGGLFVAGLVVGNLLKASGRAATSSSTLNDNGERYPVAEDVPAADLPGEDPWPAEPRSEAIP